MKQTLQTRSMAISGLLTALGLLIPLIMPLKLTFPLSTYTFASHVPIFLGLFINPQVAILVTFGTTLGFMMSFPPIVTLRAASHLIFVIIGCHFLEHRTLKSNKQWLLFNIFLAIIHGISEFLVVLVFFTEDINSGLLVQMLLFLGIGTMIHSVIDFSLAKMIAKKLEIL